jgi:hypothetical protein
LSIITLYRSSRKNSKHAYNAGYATACQDLLNFIQQGVSESDVGQSPSGASNNVEGGGMTIGKVMDWTEARVDAIKEREEEEDEDEEREKDIIGTSSTVCYATCGGPCRAEIGRQETWGTISPSSLVQGSSESFDISFLSRY